MKIINRQDFAQLAEGTIYCTGEKWVFGPLCRKGRTVFEDCFLYSEITDTDWVNSENRYEDLESSLINGKELNLNTDECLDMDQSSDSIFMVYSPTDLSNLVRLLNESMELLRDKHE